MSRDPNYSQNKYDSFDPVSLFSQAVMAAQFEYNARSPIHLKPSVTLCMHSVLYMIVLYKYLMSF